MLQLGIFGFAHPWLLAAFVALPALWWLLRITPPSPRLVRFPALRLLLGIAQAEETPARTPWWLVVLRLLLASLVVLALAEPLIHPRATAAREGALLIAVDNGWAAARNWSERQRALDSLIEGAARDGRPVMILPTALPASGDKLEPSKLFAAGDAREYAQALTPLPWPTDRAAATAALDGVKLPEPATVVWLSDGLGSDDRAQDAAFTQRLQSFGPVELLADPPDEMPHLLLPPSTQGSDLGLTVLRANAGDAETVTVSALDERGHPAGEATLAFGAGQRLALAKLVLPVELRNQIARLEIAGEHTAGATVLLDDRWRRRPVGVVQSPAAEQAEPLLGGHYYLTRALKPYSEVVEAPLDQIMKRELAVFVLTDGDPLAPSQRGDLERWIRNGGTLVRFAGPRLAEGDDDLVPVRLRRGERDLGGAMSWDKPATLAPFAATSPFAGLAIPSDVAIKRQVLAEPALDLDQKTWARLADGTPLVTAERLGAGWLVLVHTTANPDWSNLPFSGLFVEMLRRIVALSNGVAGGAERQALPPWKSLDAYGALAEPFPAATALAPAAEPPKLGPQHPPGYYGTEASRRALNLSNRVIELAPLSDLPRGIARGVYGGEVERDLKPWLLGAAALLALLDLIASLGLRGFLGAGLIRGAAGAAALALVLAATPAAAASAPSTSDDAFAIAATSITRLAYVTTGDPSLDNLSREGLDGLTEVLNARTAVEAGSPMGVNLERDELAFFPLLYWPVSERMATLSPHAIEKVSEYLHNGGQIVFDTRQPDRAGANWLVLRRLLDALNLPALIPVPDNHVLTRSFYLIHDFPGRFDGSTVWVERGDETVNDGVSSVVIGGNDWAGAWATDGSGRSILPVVPGGERQREMAMRFGINLVMYSLTGNYKGDQVHLPAILERLGL
jgi:hypothetical protein